MGAQVIITEVDPMRALEASMDGFDVMAMQKAAEVGDMFCTAAGDKNVIVAEHFELMKDGAILSNTGHFNVEIEIPALRALANETRMAREFVEEFTLADGRRLYLIADGRLVNLAAAEGHPPSVMDMSFATQALATEFCVQNKGKLSHKVHTVPVELENYVAGHKLESMGISIDELIYFDKLHWAPSKLDSGKTAVSKLSHEFNTVTNYSLNLGMTTRIYGTYFMKGGGSVKAIRHIINPSIGYSYAPDKIEPPQPLKPQPPVNVSRVTPVQSDSIPVTRRYQQLLNGTVWQNYELTGVQFPVNPMQNDQPQGNLKGNGQCYVAGTDHDTLPAFQLNDCYLANVTMETFVQSTSCATCHSYGAPLGVPRTPRGRPTFDALVQFQIFTFMLLQAQAP